MERYHATGVLSYTGGAGDARLHQQANGESAGSG